MKNRDGSSSTISDKPASLIQPSNAIAPQSRFALNSLSQFLGQVSRVSGHPVATPSLGGVSRASLAAIASVPLAIPSLAKSGARVFFFANAGSIGESSAWNGMLRRSPELRALSKESNASGLFGSPRVSFGCGLIIPVADMIRLEFTYSIPFVRSDVDSVKPFQVGFGLDLS